jgi:hypothetical protein
MTSTDAVAVPVEPVVAPESVPDTKHVTTKPSEWVFDEEEQEEEVEDKRAIPKDAGDTKRLAAPPPVEHSPWLVLAGKKPSLTRKRLLAQLKLVEEAAWSYAMVPRSWAKSSRKKNLLRDIGLVLDPKQIRGKKMAVRKYSPPASAAATLSPDASSPDADTAYVEFEWQIRAADDAKWRRVRRDRQPARKMEDGDFAAMTEKQTAANRIVAPFDATIRLIVRETRVLFAGALPRAT